MIDESDRYISKIQGEIKIIFAGINNIQIRMLISKFLIFYSFLEFRFQFYLILWNATRPRGMGEQHSDPV